MGIDRDAQVPVNEVPQIEEVLDQKRLIESPFLAIGCNDLGMVGGGLRDRRDDRIDRNGLGDGKRDQRHPQQNRDQKKQAPGDISDHRIRSSGLPSPDLPRGRVGDADKLRSFKASDAYRYTNTVVGTLKKFNRSIESFSITSVR
jgi:hypothetical protein